MPIDDRHHDRVAEEAMKRNLPKYRKMIGRTDAQARLPLEPTDPDK